MWHNFDSESIEIKSIGDSPSIFFSLHPRLDACVRWMSQKKTHQRRLPDASCVHEDDNWYRRELWQRPRCWVCFLLQRSFIDLLGKRVYSGQTWETKLWTNLYLLLFIVESQTGGISCWTLFLILGKYYLTCLHKATEIKSNRCCKIRQSFKKNLQM